ncbi:MAG: right-handed parallel beta-helix repeat-containing protein [Chloroflexi bacterium]|nr:right-handed parallel beta-helix repeat-containing protein [Chloroflexota bacterium]
MKWKFILIGTLCLATVLPLMGSTSAAMAQNAGATYYVAPDGSNDNPGTIEAPWESIQYAADNASPGDLIFVRGGVYNEIIEFSRSGTSSAPIVFRNYPDEQPLIVSPDWSGFVFVGVEWIVVDGFALTDMTNDGIFISDAHNIEVNNCEVYGSGNIGIHIVTYEGPATNNTVRNCSVYDNGGEGIYLDVKADSPAVVEDNIVENNLVFNNAYEGIQNTHESGAEPKPSGTLIRNNYIYNNGPDWATLDLGGDNLRVIGNVIYDNNAPVGGIYYSGGSGSIIQDNIIQNNQHSWAVGASIVLDNISSSVVIDNQIVDDCGNGCDGIIVQSPGLNLDIRNNTISTDPISFEVPDGDIEPTVTPQAEEAVIVPDDKPLVDPDTGILIAD